jgi:toxin YoeB
MGFKIIFTGRAEKDAKKLEQAGLDKKAKELLKLIKENPYQKPPPYEKLVGDLKGQYSRRINIMHRLVYEIIDEKNIIKILSMWSHYE